MEYYKQYLMLKADLINDPENENTIEQLNVILEHFSEQNKPLILHPSLPNNEIIRNEKKFTNMLIAIEQNGMRNENLTIFEFYSRIEIIDKKNGSRK